MVAIQKRAQNRKQLRITQNALFPDDHKPQILRIEKNLNTIGVFTPRHQRPPELTKVIKTTVRLPEGQRMEANVQILGTQKYGLPTTPDQDKFYAFTKILDDIRQAEGGLQNPVRFNYAEMVRLLGRVKGGKVHREIDEWLERMTATTIKSTGAIWRASRKRYVSDIFHVFDRAVKVGEQLENGDKAEKNYVWISSWLLENFEANYVLPIDYEIYRQMRVPIAKALVPLIQVWFYASRNTKNGTIQKRFRELAELLGTRPYTQKSKIHEKMGPALDELKEFKLIRYWEFQPTSDGKDFKLILAPGERFISEKKAELAHSGDSPQAKEVQSLLERLLGRGVREETARELLFNTKDLSALKLRFEFVEDVIQRRKHGRNKIKNEAGFIVYFLDNEARVPDEFSARVENEMLAVDEVEKLGLKKEYSDYCYRQVLRHFESQLTAAEQNARVETAQINLRRDDAWTYFSEEDFKLIVMDEVLKALESEVELPNFEQFCQVERVRQAQIKLLA